MLLHFGRVERFITKLKAVNEVVLNFNSSEEVAYIFTEDNAIAWSEGLGSLLNTIVERGCSSLQVRGLLKIMDVYREVTVMSPRSQPPSLLSRLKNLFTSAEFAPTPSVLAGQTWKYERNPHTNWSFSAPKDILTEFSPQAIAHSSLTHLTIGTKSFLCPPLLQWTYSALSTSPITDLTIEDVDFFGATWSILSDLLPQAAPGLKGLKLRKCRGLSDKQVTQFIKGFPKLERLSLEQLSSPWTDGLNPFANSSNAVLPALARLTTLRGEAKWILPALTSYSASFPALQNLQIVFSRGVRRSWTIVGDSDVRALDDRCLLAELTKLGPNPKFSVDIELLAPEDIVSWMRQATEPITASGGTPEWMDCVSGIIVVVDKRLEWSHEWKVKDTIRQWYQQFPRLKKLIIKSMVNEGYVVRSVEQFCQLKMSKVVKGLEDFEVNGRRWELSAE
ncbi:hypothetical protein H1R20_g1046, partial [Candolleomyces eurysporus]